MNEFIKKNAAPLLKLGIGALVAWGVLMLVLLWMSGGKETAEAQATGKRFIIHTSDGRVDGLVNKNGDKKAEEALVVPPPVSDIPKEDMAEVPSFQPSASPIPAVSNDLLEQMAGVPLPRISESKIRPWQYYVKPFRRQNELPLVAILITGLGQGKQVTEQAIAMDDRISLAFSPYATFVGSWTQASRMTGHEMFVELPFQTENYPTDDPGPFSILLSRSNTENLKNLYWAMSRFQGYVGVLSPPTEVVTTNPDTFNLLSEEIAKRGLLFVAGRPNTQLPVSEGKNSLTSLNADIWIDEELSEMTIQARLATLEQIAQRNGVAIGVARAYPISLSQIKSWQESLGARGIVIAPVSYLAKLKYN